MPAPVGFTCPIIDRAIKDLDRASRQLNTVDLDFDELSPSKLKELLAEARDWIDEAISSSGVLEEIRDANARLRQWGEEQEHRAEYAEREREDLESRVGNLENELEDVSSELDDVRQEVKTEQVRAAAAESRVYDLETSGGLNLNLYK
jgi:chromosome segregation ATPase